MLSLDRMGEKFKDLFVKKEEANVGDLHEKFLRGIIGQKELFQMLPVDKVDEFIDYHNQHQTAEPADRSKIFKSNQIDNLIENKRLNKEVAAAHGISVIEKWN